MDKQNYTTIIQNGLSFLILMLVMIICKPQLSAQQFYGNAFEYELKSNDSLYLDLVLFVDCTADTTFTPSDIVLSTNSKTDSFAPSFRYAEDVTPLEHGIKSQCKDTTSTIAEGVKKQVYRIGIDLGQTFPNDCQINFSWEDHQVITYQSGVNEVAYMEGWINYCQFQEGHSPEYQHDPPFITKRDVPITHDPWLKDAEEDSVSIGADKLSTSKGSSSYYNNGCGYYFPCCLNFCTGCTNSFNINSYTGAFELLFQCNEDYFYLENDIREYRNGQQIAKMPYEMALRMKDMPITWQPQLKDKGPFHICVGDTLNLNIKYDTHTQQDSIYLTNWQFFDSTATMDTQPNQPVKGQFQWVPEPGDYRENAYQLKARAVNENNYKLAKTQTIPIKVKKDTGVHVHQIEQSRVCDSLYVMADSVTGPGPYRYDWSINGKSVDADSVLHYKFDSNGTYHLKLAVHSRPACDSFHYTDTLEVKNLVEATIQAQDTVCPVSKPTTIPVNASSGADSFSYAWNNGLTGDTIRPVIKQDSVLAVQVTNQDGCTGTDTFHVSTYPHQPITCQFAEKAYCWNGPVDTLNICDKPVFWQGTGIQQDSLFEPKAVYAGHTDTFGQVASYQDSFGCVYHDTLKAIVKKKPEPAFEADTVCQDGSVVSLPDSATNGSLDWSGNGVGDSVFDPALVTTGTHFARFTHTNALGCQFRDSLAIEVYGQPSIDTQITVCINNGPLELPDFPGAQNWRGPGVQQDTMHVAGLQAGTYHPRFDYHNASTTCQMTDSIKVEILDTPQVSAGGPLEACHQDNLIGLNGKPSGGQWMAPEIMKDSVNPTELGTGQHALVYAYTDTGTGCNNTDTLEMVVHALADLAFEVQPQSGEAPLEANLTYTGSDSLAVYEWFIGPEADTLQGDSQTYTFEDTGQHVVILKGTTQEGCTNTLSKVVQVNDHTDGIYQKAEAIGVQLYPNPARDRVILEAKKRITKVEIRDLKGAMIKRVSQDGQKAYTIKVGTLNSGYYLVEVMLQNGQRAIMPMVLK